MTAITTIESADGPPSETCTTSSVFVPTTRRVGSPSARRPTLLRPGVTTWSVRLQRRREGGRRLRVAGPRSKSSFGCPSSRAGRTAGGFRANGGGDPERPWTNPRDLRNASRSVGRALAGHRPSDVAFFLHGPAAVCRGKGDVVEPRCPPRPFDDSCSSGPPLARFKPTPTYYRPPDSPEGPGRSGRFSGGIGDRDPRAIVAILFNRLQPAPKPCARPLPGPGLPLVRPRETPRLAPDERERLGRCRSAWPATPGAARIARVAARRARHRTGVRVVTCTMPSLAVNDSQHHRKGVRPCRSPRVRSSSWRRTRQQRAALQSFFASTFDDMFVIRDSDHRGGKGFFVPCRRGS